MKKLSSAALAFAFIAALFSFSACKKDVTSNCTDGSANYPYLAVGHTFTYYTLVFGSEDTITYTITGSPSAGSYAVDAASSNGNNAGYFVDAYWHACSKDYYVSNTTDYNQFGHWTMSLDANVGDTWTRSQNGNTFNYKLLSKTAGVTTYWFGQTFTNCYQYTFNQQGTFNVDTVYFKPDKGLVYYDGSLANYELLSTNF